MFLLLLAMIVTLKKVTTNKEELQPLLSYLENFDIKIQEYCNESRCILALLGDTSKIDVDTLSSFDIVNSVTKHKNPCLLSSRKEKNEDTKINVLNEVIGGGSFNVIAGPCAVESESQIVDIAKSVKASGATFLRGGAFKPRTSPYSFQGLQKEGLDYLLMAKKLTGLPVVSEIMSIDKLELFRDIDVIQVGARNMQNYELLKELSYCDKPILLKRGSGNTIDELLMSAEYILSGTNQNVILCERG
ncbi:MAG: 3-deoxy-7-phosphoheptulonate synthase, partial [Oscillospiraceae bacterium]